jgi:hypothetical protein
MKLVITLLFALLQAVDSIAQEASLPKKENFQLFLLIGQSNMAGRGKLEQEDKKPHPRVLVFNKDNSWVAAVDPLHFDKPAAGVGLGKTFGMMIAEGAPDATIGLIPCAVGGSPIDSWKPGVFYPPTKSHPWDDAIARASIAIRSGELKGILWHQGESDSTPELAESYEAKLHDLIARLRKELHSPEVPFIAGQMGQFDDVPWAEGKRQVDAAHQSLATKVRKTAFVSSAGLKHTGDKVHFDAASLREFGKRYADAYMRVNANK